MFSFHLLIEYFTIISTPITLPFSESYILPAVKDGHRKYSELFFFTYKCASRTDVFSFWEFGSQFGHLTKVTENCEDLNSESSCVSQRSGGSANERASSGAHYAPQNYFPELCSVENGFFPSTQLHCDASTNTW